MGLYRLTLENQANTLGQKNILNMRRLATFKRILMIWLSLQIPLTVSAHADNVLNNTVTVYHTVSNSKTSESKIIEKFEWLDLARWYRLIDLMPSQPVFSATIPERIDTEQYAIIETDQYGDPRTSMILEGPILTVISMQNIYKNYYDVKDMTALVDAEIKMQTAQQPRPEPPAPPLFELTLKTGTKQDQIFFIREPKLIDAIEGRLKNLPEVSVIETMFRPVDFFQPGSFKIKKLFDGHPNIPLEFYLSHHQIMTLKREMVTMHYRDRLNVIDEIQYARKLREMLKAAGQPLTKRY